MIKSNKNKIYSLLFILFVLFYLFGCEKSTNTGSHSNDILIHIDQNVDSKYSVDIYDESFNLWEIIQSKNIDDISLTIYYRDKFILPRTSWDIQRLIDSDMTQKIVVSGVQLSEYSDILSQIDYSVLKPIYDDSSYLHADVYYIFESAENGKIFDVAMWSTNGVLVNGKEVEYTPIFKDVIKPFFTEDDWEKVWDYE